MPDKKPLISIPILTYNGEKYLREQLDSIYAQTYKNIEVLAFDDGSTDHTVEILKEYHKSHGLKYTIHSKNLGFIKNAIFSLNACNGLYIAPADQDDIWKEKKLEVLMQSIGDSMMIYADSSTMQEDGSKCTDHYFGAKCNLISGNTPLQFAFGNSISAHAMLFKRELVKKALPIPSVIDYHDWWLAFTACCLSDIKLYPEPLVYYRRHCQQVTNYENKKNYTFFQRFTFREHRLIKNREKILHQLNAFQTFVHLDEKDKKLLLSIIQEMKDYKIHFFNKKLEKILQENAEILFGVFKHSPKEQHKHIQRLSRGLWYYRLKLYT